MGARLCFGSVVTPVYADGAYHFPAFNPTENSARVSGFAQGLLVQATGGSALPQRVVPLASVGK